MPDSSPALETHWWASCDDPERWKRACHEAGHVLTARLLGVPVGYATAKRDASMATWDSEFAPRANLMCCLGGFSGELAILGAANECNSRADASNVKQLMRRYRITPDEVFALRDRVDRLLRTHRDDLRAIATQLYLRENLDGPSIDALIDHA